MDVKNQVLINNFPRDINNISVLKVFYLTYQNDTLWRQRANPWFSDMTSNLDMLSYTKGFKTLLLIYLAKNYQKWPHATLLPYASF
jgi:hypothetical protein